MSSPALAVDDQLCASSVSMWLIPSSADFPRKQTAARLASGVRRAQEANSASGSGLVQLTRWNGRESVPKVSGAQKMKQDHSLLARVGAFVFENSVISRGKAEAAVGALPSEQSLKTSLG